MGEKLIIDRAKWLRGEGPKNSYLIRQADGKQCCLGFDLLRRGFTDEELIGQRQPTEVARNKDHAIQLKGLVERCSCGSEGHYDSTAIGTQLMSINDSEGLSSEEREQKIVGLFADIGVEVEFVN